VALAAGTPIPGPASGWNVAKVAGGGTAGRRFDVGHKSC